MTKKKPRPSMMRHLSEALYLPRTAERILESLARAGRSMPVKELVRHVRMSERGVRKHLSLLVGRGLLQRRAVPRGSRKIAYEYSLRPVQDLLDAARDDFTKTLQKLEEVVRKVGRTKASPRSASSSRN